MRVVILLLLLGLFPDTRAGDLDEAIRFYSRGEYKKAIDSLLPLKSLQQANPEIRLWLGKSYYKTRQWDPAISELEKAVQLQPANASYHLWLGRAFGLRASHSIFFMAARWAKRVVKEFEAARKLDPLNPDIRFDLLEYYLSAPGMLGGGSDKAEAEALAISKIDPLKGYAARATIFEKDKKWDLARKELAQATVEYPEKAGAWNDLAAFLLDRNEFEAALENAGKALKLEPGLKTAQLTAAAAEIRLNKDLDQAAGHLEDLAAGPLTDNDPAFEDVYYWLGECFLAKADKAKARAAFNTALGFDPDYDRAKQSLSRLK